MKFKLGRHINLSKKNYKIALLNNEYMLLTRWPTTTSETQGKKFVPKAKTISLTLGEEFMYKMMHNII